MLPSLSANSSYSIQRGRSIDPNNNEIVTSDFFSNNYSLNASIDIFQGFQKINRIAATKFLYQAAKEETLQEKYLLAFRVISAFYDVQFYEGLLQISKDQVAISLKNYNLVERQIELGLKAGSDRYDAESILLSDKLKVTQNENNLKAAKLKLVQEMNLENATEDYIDIVDEIDFLEEDSSVVSVDSIYDKAVTFIPIIQAQQLRVEAAKKEISYARGNLYPSLGLAAGYGTGFFETNVDATGTVIPFRTQISDNASQFVGVSLSIPIFESWSVRSRIKQQKIALLQESNNLNLQKQELNKMIQELVQAYNATGKEYEQTQKNEESRLLAFEIAQKKYDKGLISTIDLFQTKNFYTVAQNENLQLRLKLKVQKKTLDFYLGLPVFNITQ
jgi:outer membrane protein TolC